VSGGALVRFEATIGHARTKFGTVKTAEQMRQAKEPFQAFLDCLPTEEIALTPGMGLEAPKAAHTCGKVIDHKAALNPGDCFSCTAVPPRNP